MNHFVALLWLVGVGSFVVGILGFVDTRKADKRFKTGYKNNEADSRNFGRSAKRVLFGIGVCIVAGVMTDLVSTTGRVQVDPVARSSFGPAEQTQIASSEAAPASAPVKLSPLTGNVPAENDVRLNSNERIVQQPLSQPDPVSVASSNSNASVASPIADASSFNCDEDGTFFAANICRNSSLAANYKRLMREYDGAQNRIGGADVGVRIEQERWIAEVTRECATAECLIEAFEGRVADLNLRYRKAGS